MPSESQLQASLFAPVNKCWVCDGSELTSIATNRLQLDNLVADPRFGHVLSDYNHKTIVLNRCQHCGFMQPSVLPSHPDYFNTIYNLNWTQEWMEKDFNSGYKDIIFQTILNELQMRVHTGSHALLDVGTHVGRMLELARRNGWQPEAIELNPQTASFAAKRTGVPVHRKNAKALAASEVRYDAVVITDVLEHIPGPLGILTDLRGLLKPGGWIAVKVPYGANQLFKQRIRHLLDSRNDPDIASNFVHVNHFGPGSLKRVLQRAGFDSIRIQPAAPEYPPGGGLKGLLSRFMRRAVFIAARSFPFGAKSPLSMNLQAFAHNPLD